MGVVPGQAKQFSELKAIARDDVATYLDQIARQHDEITWLRQGLETALDDLQAGRARAAMGEIRGTLAGKEKCW